MAQSLTLSIAIVPIVCCLGLSSQAQQPAARQLRIADGTEGDVSAEITAVVGERFIIVRDNPQAEIEIAVRRLPPDKQAVIYVELRPKQSNKKGIMPMALPTGRWFRLVNVNSGHGLSVEDRSLNEGARLIQESVDVTEGGLLWRLFPAAEGWYVLQNQTTEQVMSLPDNRKNAGANLVQAPLDSDSLDQQWRPLWLDGNRFVIVNRRSGLALAVAYGATHSGATICQWPLHIDWAQHQWRIEVADLQ